jgi:hypothetical protein
MKLPKLGKPDFKVVTSFFFPVFWGTKDNGLLAELFEIIARRVNVGVHCADNFFTWQRNNSMMDDKEFMRSWESNAQSESDKAIIWRRYILCCAAYHSVHLDGDFVECGCYTGSGVKTVMDYLGGVDFPKKFWGYDLFEHSDEMEHHSMQEHGPELFNKVKSRFSAYPQVKIIKGLVPETFVGQSPDKIAYLHIDMNEATAEVHALESLFDRVTPGGIIILDDYEWAGPYRKQKLAEDPWFEERNHRVMPLPTGQGLVIKH